MSSDPTTIVVAPALSSSATTARTDDPALMTSSTTANRSFDACSRSPAGNRYRAPNKAADESPALFLAVIEPNPHRGRHRLREKRAAEQRSADRRYVMRPNQSGERIYLRRNRRRIDEQCIEIEPRIRVIAGFEEEVAVSACDAQLVAAF